MSQGQRMYKTMMSVNNVLVSVPKQGPYMKKEEAHQFELNGLKIDVKTHWRHGLIVAKSKKILFRLFYGISQEDLGRKIVATVNVIEKTIEDGQVFILLDIIKTPGTPLSKIKFIDDDGHDCAGILIPCTQTKVVFQSMVDLDDRQ